MKRMHVVALMLAVVLLVMQPARAQSDELPYAITQHTIEIDGEALDYTATAGFIKVDSRDGDHLADLFYVAYTSGEPGERPLTFLFNGGPGSSSIWLHLLAAGPYRAALVGDSGRSRTPATLVENEETWLRFTDLVFVDPLGTGFSRTADEVDPAQFYQPDGDVAIMGAFLHNYVEQYDRWESPLFVAGESYGGARGALLTRRMQTRYSMGLNGVVFISPVFDYGVLNVNDDLAVAMTLPTLTATAWFHEELDAELQALTLPELTARVEGWAVDTYLPALIQGDSLPEREGRQVTRQLARLTGLSAETVMSHNRRIDTRLFQRRLFGFRALNPFDGRESAFFGRDDIDALLIQIAPAWQAYLSETLAFEMDAEYVYFSRDVNRAWAFPNEPFSAFTVTNTLREAMLTNNSMMILVARGYYDLAVPYFTTEHALNRLGLPDNIARTYYEGGHMPYLDDQHRAEFAADVRDFIALAASD